MSVDDYLDARPELRMELPCVATPQQALPEVGEQGDTVSHVKLHIERQRTAVDEGVPVMERGAVMQYLFAPVHRFISGKSRSTCIDEHDFTGIGKYLEVVSALHRELRHGYLSVLVRVVLQQIFAAEHPFVPLFRVGGESRPETVPAVVAAGIEAVRHVRPDLDALHIKVVVIPVFLVALYTVMNMTGLVTTSYIALATIVLMMATPAATVIATYTIHFNKEPVLTSSCSLMSSIFSVAMIPFLIITIEILKSMGIFS